MPSKKSVKLNSSSSVLKFVDGSFDFDVLEKLLEEAFSQNITKSQSIAVTREKRAANFDENNPEWEKINYQVKLSTLYRIYSQEAGQSFKPKSFEEEEAEYARQRARMIWR